MTTSHVGLWMVATAISGGAWVASAQSAVPTAHRMPALEQRFQTLAASSDGRVGICAGAVATAATACVNGDDRFPMQSVMKLVVAAAVMEAVDGQRLTLNDRIVVRPEDASPGPQEFANLVTAKGRLEVTVDELVRRAVVDSDSTSVDVLIERLGGVSALQAFLQRQQMKALRLDRDERHLQAETVGLVWQPAFANARTWEAAIAAVPAAAREAAWARYLTDPRDTATPRGMVQFLTALATGRLLSAASTRHLLAVMAATATGADRLKAGLPQGWTIGHKTGTGREWRGMTSDTNDVGLLTAPDGRTFPIAVFVAQSRRSNEQRAAVIAEAARLVTQTFQTE